MAVALITGCSSGFGKLTAVEMARRGDTVFASMRDPSRAGALRSAAAEAGVTVNVIQLDVTDAGSVDRAVATTLDRAGRIDIVVNNAGIPLWSPVECYTGEELRAAFETNVFGVYRVTRAVLPAMRRQRAGLLILVSSISAFHHWPFGGVYCATKAAAEALYDALHFELLPLNIQVTIVQPGNFKTEAVNNAHLTQAWRERSAPPEYARLARTLSENPLPGQLSPGDPEDVAALIAEVAHDPRPQRRYLVGDDALRRSKQSPAERAAETLSRMGLSAPGSAG